MSVEQYCKLQTLAGMKSMIEHKVSRGRLSVLFLSDGLVNECLDDLRPKEVVKNILGIHNKKQSSWRNSSWQDESSDKEELRLLRVVVICVRTAPWCVRRSRREKAVDCVDLVNTDLMRGSGQRTRARGESADGG